MEKKQNIRKELSVDFEVKTQSATAFFVSEFSGNTVDLCFLASATGQAKYEEITNCLTFSDAKKIKSQFQSWIDYWFNCRKVNAVTFQPCSDRVFRATCFCLKNLKNYSVDLQRYVITIKK